MFSGGYSCGMKAWRPARALKLVDCFVFVLKWSFSLCHSLFTPPLSITLLPGPPFSLSLFSLFLSFSLSLFLSRSFHLCECVCVSLSFSPPLSLNTPLMCDRSLEYGVWGANRMEGEAPLQLGELWEIHRLQGVHVC